MLTHVFKMTLHKLDYLNFSTPFLPCPQLWPHFKFTYVLLDFISPNSDRLDVLWKLMEGLICDVRSRFLNEGKKNNSLVVTNLLYQCTLK